MSAPEPGHPCPTCGQIIRRPTAGRPRGGKLDRYRELAAQVPPLTDAEMAAALDCAVARVRKYRSEAKRLGG